MELKGRAIPRDAGWSHAQALPLADSQVQLLLPLLLLSLSCVPLQLQLHVCPSQSPRLLLQDLQLLLQLFPGLLQELSLPGRRPEVSRDFGT